MKILMRYLKIVNLSFQIKNNNTITGSCILKFRYSNDFNYMLNLKYQLSNIMVYWCYSVLNSDR